MEILIVDDHAVLRQGLVVLLQRVDGVRVIDEADTIEAALALTERDYDLVLLDLRLPGRDGLSALKDLARLHPAAAVVLISGEADAKSVAAARGRGARGFIPKSLDANTLFGALRTVLDGGSWFPDGVAPVPPRPSARTGGLTPRQLDVLARLCAGLSNKEIGLELSMSENTVRSHVAAIFQVLGAKSRTEAAMLARDGGVL